MHNSPANERQRRIQMFIIFEVIICGGIVLDRSILQGDIVSTNTEHLKLIAGIFN